MTLTVSDSGLNVVRVSYVTTDEVQGGQVIASEFFIHEGQVAKYVRHDAGVADALSVADLDEQQTAVTTQR